MEQGKRGRTKGNRDRTCPFPTLQDPLLCTKKLSQNRKTGHETGASTDEMAGEQTPRVNSEIFSKNYCIGRRMGAQLAPISRPMIGCGGEMRDSDCGMGGRPVVCCRRHDKRAG